MIEMPREIYLQSDPARMYKVMRQTKKPCFAFKILAAGRICGWRGCGGVPHGLREHQAQRWRVRRHVSPNRKDEVKENAEIVHGILTGA